MTRPAKCATLETIGRGQTLAMLAALPSTIATRREHNHHRRVKPMTTTNPAYEYALLIRAEILALETLLENRADIDDDIQRTRDGEPAEMDPELLAECVAAQNELGIEEWNEDTDLVSDYIENTCLEFTVLRSVGGERERIEILRTCGGPRCDIVRDTLDGTMIEIIAHDGGDSSTLRMDVPNVAAWLDDIAGCY